LFKTNIFNYIERPFISHMWLMLQIEVFPYSVFYIFFEQYLDIWNTTIVSLSLALGKLMAYSFLYA
jgi:Niemann-Pick C1 protein